MAIKDPCPCPRAVDGSCPCDPNIPIINKGQNILAGSVGMAGDAVLASSMMGQGDPMMGALGGGMSGLAKGGLLGGILGAGFGLIQAGQARADYENVLQAQRDQHLLDRTTQPEYMADGGIIKLAKKLQTEVGEMIALPDAQISKVKASKKHKDMDRDEITDIVPEGAIVFSEKKTFSPKKYADKKLSEALAYYDEFDQYELGELKVGDILGDSKKMSYADAVAKVKKYYPCTEEKSLVAEQTNELNKKSRVPILQFLYNLQSGNRVKKETDEVEEIEHAEGGYPDYNPDELNIEPKQYGMTQYFGNEYTNYTLPSQTSIPQMDEMPYALTLDPFAPQGTQISLNSNNQFAPINNDNQYIVHPENLKRQRENNVVNPIPTIPSQVTSNQPSNTRLLPNNNGTENKNSISAIFNELRSNLDTQRKEMDARYATDKNIHKNLISDKNTNNTLQLASQVLFSGAQSGRQIQPYESVGLINEQYRGIPGAQIDQQAQALAANTNSVTAALAAAGVSPGEIAKYSAQATQNVANAQSGLRSNALAQNANLNRSRIAEYRNVIQNNNQRSADAQNHLTDFTNRKLSSVGSYINDYFTNKDKIADTEYKINANAATDYEKSKNAIINKNADLNAINARVDINNRALSIQEQQLEEFKKLQQNGNSDALFQLLDNDPNLRAAILAKYKQ